MPAGARDRPGSDALASDYHYPRRAMGCWRWDDLDAAAGLVSEGPARLLGLADRGRIAPGLRADLVILEPRVAGGRVTHLTSPLAERFLA